jgi:hypothetical protein
MVLNLIFFGSFLKAGGGTGPQHLWTGDFEKAEERSGGPRRRPVDFECYVRSPASISINRFRIARYAISLIEEIWAKNSRFKDKVIYFQDYTEPSEGLS